MKRVFIKFGVNVGGLKEAMSEHVSHLLEADPTPDHPGCRSMPESMRAQSAGRDPGKLEMTLRDATHRTDTSNRAKRCAGTQEDERLSAFGPTVLDVFSDGLSNIIG
jgi:hypothetical protein